MKATKKSKNPFQGMTVRVVTDYRGVRRTMYAKRFDDELRVYRIEGDVTDITGIKDACRQLSEESGCEKVLVSL